MPSGTAAVSVFLSECQFRCVRRADSRAAGGRVQKTDSRASDACQSVSGKRFLPDGCMQAGRAVRTRRQRASAIGAYGFLSDNPVEEDFWRKVEPETVKSSAKALVAVTVLPPCGRHSVALRTKIRNRAHKRTARCAQKKCFFRNAVRILAERRPHFCGQAVKISKQT